jgi:hypothetical protein
MVAKGIRPAGEFLVPERSDKNAARIELSGSTNNSVVVLVGFLLDNL